PVVEQHDVRRLTPAELDRLLPACYVADHLDVRLLLEQKHERLAEDVVVFHHDDAHSHQCHRTPFAVVMAREASRGSNGLLDLAGLEAARTDVGPCGLAVQHDADALEVRVETPLRGHHRVAPAVAEGRFLAANGADARHESRSVADGYGLPEL